MICCDHYYEGIFTPLPAPATTPFDGVKYGRLEANTGLIITGHFKTCLPGQSHSTVPELDVGGAPAALLLVALVVAVIRERRVGRVG